MDFIDIPDAVDEPIIFSNQDTPLDFPPSIPEPPTNPISAFLDPEPEDALA
jgi:hypothetical protein